MLVSQGESTLTPQLVKSGTPTHHELLPVFSAKGS
jgi:hypothetical protein